MFALAAPGRLQELLESAGFVEVLVQSVELNRTHQDLDAYFEETLDLSRPFADAVDGLAGPELEAVRDEIAALAVPYVQADGSIALPGRSLVAAAM